MSIVLYDPELGLLLDKLVSFRGKEPPKLKFREMNKIKRTSKGEENNEVPQSKIANTKKYIEYKNCKKCHICKMELNLNHLANLLCKILKNVTKRLVVYLVVSDEKYIYSTVTLNYIKSLYSVIVTNYRHHYDDLDIILNSKFDLTILPIYDYHKLKEEKKRVVELGNFLETMSCSDFDITHLTEDNVYIHLYSQFLFEDFYQLKNKRKLNENEEHNHIGKPALSDLDCMMPSEEEDKEEENLLWIKPYQNIMFCGTFDHLHFGHKLILLLAFLSCKKNLHIGVVASKEMLSNKSNFTKVQHLEVRKELVQVYLESLIKIYEGNKNLVYNNDETTHEQGQKIYNYVSVDFQINQELTSLNYYTLNIHSPQNGPRNVDDFEEESLNAKHESRLITVSKGGNRVFSHGPMRVEIFDLFDVIGPSVELTEKFGLLISKEIIDNAIKVNESRKNSKLVPWDLIIVGLVCYFSDDQLVKLSSSTIRELI